jgi:hypothetical protein
MSTTLSLLTRTVVAIAMLLSLLSTLVAQSSEPKATHVFITYRCKPADRPAFLRLLQEDQLPRLEQWKKDGVMLEFLLLVNQFVDENTWDATLLLQFERYEQTARWTALEREFPGGLGSRLLAVAAPTTTYLADLQLQGGAAGDRSKSIFVLIPYTWRDKASYLDFIKVYGLPQFDAWVQEKVVACYGVFTNHHPTGKPWDVMLVFEYHDVEALSKRDLVKQQVRVGLGKQPAWRLASEGKAEIRTEHEVVMAAPVVAKKGS